MKKIIALLMALVMTMTIFFNTYKVHAMALPASLLTYLIECCAEVLVGSGTVSQQDFNSMNTSDIFDLTTQTLPGLSHNSFNTQKIASLLEKFIKTSNLPFLMFKDGLGKFFFEHLDELKGEEDQSFLKGYSSSIAIPDRESVV